MYKSRELSLHTQSQPQSHAHIYKYTHKKNGLIKKKRIVLSRIHALLWRRYIVATHNQKIKKKTMNIQTRSISAKK